MAIASTVFQYDGTQQGTLIDPDTNELLVNNEAFVYVADLLKKLARYSVPGFCMGCAGGPKVAFSKGRCAMLVDLPGNNVAKKREKVRVLHTNTNIHTLPLTPLQIIPLIAKLIRHESCKSTLIVLYLCTGNIKYVLSNALALALSLSLL
jgi:hypothetical protein